MTQPNTHGTFSAQERVPALSQDVVDVFREHMPSLPALTVRMRHRDQVLADFILRRAEQLSPGARDIAAKARVAQLAFEVYALLTTQEQVNNLERDLQQSDIVA